MRFERPSIQPKHSATSTAPAQSSDATPVCFLAIRTSTSSASAPLASSQSSNSSAVAKNSTSIPPRSTARRSVLPSAAFRPLLLVARWRVRLRPPRSTRRDINAGRDASPGRAASNEGLTRLFTRIGGRRPPAPGVGSSITMTTKADFSEQEWDLHRQAPVDAGMVVVTADQGG